MLMVAGSYGLAESSQRADDVGHFPAQCGGVRAVMAAAGGWRSVPVTRTSLGRHSCLGGSYDLPHFGTAMDSTRPGGPLPPGITSPGACLRSCGSPGQVFGTRSEISRVGHPRSAGLDHGVTELLGRDEG